MVQIPTFLIFQHWKAFKKKKKLESKSELDIHFEKNRKYAKSFNFNMMCDFHPYSIVCARESLNLRSLYI